MIDLNDYIGNDDLPARFALNAERTILFVNEVLKVLPVKFTSGFRSPSHNKRVNGNLHSRHMSALAADFVPVNGKFTKELIHKFTEIAHAHGFNCYVHDAGSGLHIHSQAT